MKTLGGVDKLVYVLNALAATLLLLMLILPFVPPKTFSVLSVLSLGVPLVILLNVLFFLYWLFKLKKQIVLSFVVLCLSYFLNGSLYKFSSSSDENVKNDIKVMNFNVRLFNLYDWSKKRILILKLLILLNQKRLIF